MNSFEHAILGITLFIVYSIMSVIWNKLTNKAARDIEDKIYEDIAERIANGEKVEYNAKDIKTLAEFLAKNQ